LSNRILETLKYYLKFIISAACMNFENLIIFTFANTMRNPSDFETTCNNNLALKIVMEDKLVDMIGDIHFYNSSWSINVDFSHLFHGNVPSFNEIQPRSIVLKPGRSARDSANSGLEPVQVYKKIRVVKNSTDSAGWPGDPVATRWLFFYLFIKITSF